MKRIEEKYFYGLTYSCGKCKFILYYDHNKDLISRWQFCPYCGEVIDK